MIFSCYQSGSQMALHVSCLNLTKTTVVLEGSTVITYARCKTNR